MADEQFVNLYVQHGFTSFPLTQGTKLPLSGVPLAAANKLSIKPEHNIGLFAGSPNSLAVIDADNQQSQAFVTNKLTDMGLYDWTTIVRTPKRQGLHFWIKLIDAPVNVQSFYKLSRSVGGGEFRLRKPAYVVAPGSCLQEGEYTFIQGGIAFFGEQPFVRWSDMTWLIGDRARVNSFSASSQDIVPLSNRPVFRKKSNVLCLFELMRTHDNDNVPRIDYRTGALRSDCFETRSEVELAIVLGLVSAGWNFEQIEELFEKEMPVHYASVRNARRYLIVAYNKGVRFYIDRRKK